MAPWASICSASATEYQDIVESISKYREKNPGITLSLLLVKGDKQLLYGNYGATGDSSNLIYRAGSLAKLFTALAILRMEQQGQIDLDQPVNAYLPRFSVKRRFSNDRQITLRHLLTHHSGLPANILKGQWSDAHFNTLVEQLRHHYLTYPPEFVMSYSNTGYSLLGAVIEEVTNQSYEDYVYEHLLKPLGMHDTGFSRSIIIKQRFVQPVKLKTSYALPPIRDVPAMGLYTTVEDMSRLMQMMNADGSYQGKPVFESHAVNAVSERQNEHVLLDFDTKVGLGVTIDHCEFSDKVEAIELGGSTMHYASHMILIPEYQLGAIVMSNSREAKGFVHKLANRLIATGVEAIDPGSSMTGSQDLVERKRVVKASQKQFEGVYLTRSGLLTYKPDESDMCACVDDKQLHLVPVPEGWFELRRDPDRPSDLKISADRVNGQSVLIVDKDDEQQRLGEYIDRSGITDDWRKRLGVYRIVNPDDGLLVTDVYLREKQSHVYLSYKMPWLSRATIEMPISILNDKLAIISGLGGGRGETLELMQTHEGEYLLYSGYLMQQVKNDGQVFLDE